MIYAEKEVDTMQPFDELRNTPKRAKNDYLKQQCYHKDKQ